jgi:hypothetical protein
VVLEEVLVELVPVVVELVPVVVADVSVEESLLPPQPTIRAKRPTTPNAIAVLMPT